MARIKFMVCMVYEKHYYLKRKRENCETNDILCTTKQSSCSIL